MGTTIRNLTDGVAAKDAAAVDQLGTGSGTVAQVHEGTKITVTGTLTDPVINNDGVNSLTGTTEIPLTGTAHDPVVNLQDLFGGVIEVGSDTDPLNQIQEIIFDKFGRYASAVGGPALAPTAPFIFGRNTDTITADGVTWSMAPSGVDWNDDGPGWTVVAPNGPFTKAALALVVKTLSWVGGGNITFKLQARDIAGSGSWTDLVTLSFASNASPDTWEGVAGSLAVLDGGEVRAVCSVPFPTVTNVFDWNVHLWYG